MIERICVDWQRCALDIRQAGVPLREASRKIGRHIDWLNHIARGEIKEPTFTDGLALLNFHNDCCGPEKTERLLK